MTNTDSPRMYWKEERHKQYAKKEKVIMDDTEKLIEEVNNALGRNDSALFIYLYAIKYRVHEINSQKVVDFYNNEIVSIMKKDAENTQKVINAMFDSNNVTHEQESRQRML